MRIPLYQIDAFTGRLFAGNPAAVCPLDAWLPDAVLQAIAAENNLAETAFLVPDGSEFQLRWFTPCVEVDLCGHATLASAYVVMELREPSRRSVSFATRSGRLTVVRSGNSYEMDFPVVPGSPCAAPDLLVPALGVTPRETFGATDLMVVLEREAEVRALRPDLLLLATLPYRGIIVTASGDEVDFVSRFFAPRVGIPEDPVTGSAHCTLTPYWSTRLGRQRLRARQVSARGGEITCEQRGDRVALSGQAVLYLQGEVVLPESVF